jgi:bifunctional DNA-binding transcriptional regulator/antitoxin component of YhaV-PrlF toxin-antitoxin module
MKVSSKRQITLPVEVCSVAKIDKGDEVDTFVDRHGVISIVKKSVGAANGLLRGVEADLSVNESQSLQSAINQ